MTFIKMRERLANFIFPEGNERRNQFERLANFDSLTDLPNRRAFDLAKSNALQSKLSLLFLI